MYQALIQLKSMVKILCCLCGGKKFCFLNDAEIKNYIILEPIAGLLSTL